MIGIFSDAEREVETCMDDNCCELVAGLA